MDDQEDERQRAAHLAACRLEISCCMLPGAVKADRLEINIAVWRRHQKFLTCDATDNEALVPQILTTVLGQKSPVVGPCWPTFLEHVGAENLSFGHHRGEKVCGEQGLLRSWPVLVRSQQLAREHLHVRQQKQPRISHTQ